MVLSDGRGSLAAICILLASVPALEGQRAGEPVAILTQIDAPPLMIEGGSLSTSRVAVKGELIFAGERVTQHAVVIECNGPASRQWYPREDAPYVGGKGVAGSTDSTAVPPCRLPDAAPSAEQSDLDDKTADQLEDELEKSGASTTDADSSALRGLGTYDAQDGMSVLRRAQVLEGRNQLTAAISTYKQLMEVWDKAPWVRWKISLLRIERVKKLLKSPAASGRGHVTPLVIGVSDYQRDDPRYPRLRYAHLDGQAFAAYLRQVDPERKFDPLLNVAATRAQIMEQLSIVESRAGDRSMAVVFVSAHGWQDPLRPYIAPYDADFQDPRDTGVAVAKILSAVREFERSIVFVDACRTPVGRLKNDVNTILDRYGRQRYEETGALPPSGKLFLVSSSQPGMPSVEGPEYHDDSGPLKQEGHGAFTYNLLKLLYLKDARSEPQPISRAELRSELLAGMEKLHQTPETGGNMLDTDRLAPLQRVPFKPQPPTSLLDWFRSPIRLAAYSPDQQAEVTAEVIDRLHTILGRGAITTLAARQAVDAYFRLSPENKRLLRGTIRVALEDEGERLLLNYLRGYEAEPPKAQFTEANEYYTLAERLAPNSLLLRARARFNAGRAMLFDFVDPAKRQQRDTTYANALSLLYDAYREDPGPYVLNALGIAFMERGEWEKAIPAFDDASKLAPDWLYPKQNRALTLMRAGKAQAAIQEYQKAIAEMPSAYTLHFNLALTYQQINRLKDAEREYRATSQRLTTAPAARAVDWARLYNAQGTLEAQRGKRGAAEKLYLKAQKQAPLPEIAHNLALISPPGVKEERLGQNRGYLNSRIELAQIYKRTGRVKKAIDEYKEILGEREDFAGAHLDLALLYLRDNLAVEERLKMANGELSQAIKARPGFWKVYLVRAEESRLQKQNAEAKANYREARRRAPDRDARREISESEKGK